VRPPLGAEQIQRQGLRAVIGLWVLPETALRLPPQPRPGAPAATSPPQAEAPSSQQPAASSGQRAVGSGLRSPYSPSPHAVAPSPCPGADPQ
jgi:hypothetical protein